MTHTLPSDIEQIARDLGGEAVQFAGTTVLVTGGHGFFGRYFIGFFDYLNKHVLKTPCKLIVVDNHLTSNDDREVNGAEPGDPRRRGGEAARSSLPSCAGAAGPRRGLGPEGAQGHTFLRHNIIEPLRLDEPLDYIFHAAGIASPYYYRKYPLETLEVATIATKQLLQLGVERRIRGFVFFSSSEIYGDPDPAHVPTAESYRGNVSCIGPRACYDESKRLGETLCAIFHELHGVPTRMVRPFNVYGPGLRENDYRVLPNFASRIKAGKPLHIYGHGKQTRTFCYVTDAIVAVIKAMLYGGPGQVYNIGNPVPEISMVELAKLIERVLGRPVPLNLIEYPDSYPADEPQRRCPDITKATLQLRYKPAVPLDEGLRRFFQWALDTYTGVQA